MAHLLETSILNLSTLIEKQNGDDRLVQLSRSLANWSSNYKPKNDNYTETDSNFITIAEEIKSLLKEI